MTSASPLFVVRLLSGRLGPRRSRTSKLVPITHDLTGYRARPGWLRIRQLTLPTVNAVRDELVWIACEMTGLDLSSDKLIEIAVLVTDADLNVLGDGVDVVIHADDAALSSMIDVVTQMHTRSGLIDEVRASTVDVATAETMVLDYIREHV